MKPIRFPILSVAVLAGVLSIASAGPLRAASATPSTAVAEVEKLVKAKIGDDTIVAFVASSNTSYRLTASDLISLKEQGVSDRVLEAMLARQRTSSEAPQVAVAQAAPVVQQQQPAQPAPGQTVYPGGPVPMQQQPTTIVVQQPAQTVVQPVYYPSTSYYGYAPSYYPYSYGYGYSSYWYPSVGVSFGLGRGWGGYYGGHYGGGYGGYHGGYGGGVHVGGGGHVGGGVHVGVGVGLRGHR